MRRFKTCNDFDLYAKNKKKRKLGVEGYKYFIKLIEKYNLILYEAKLKLIHGTIVTFHIWQKNREKIVLTWNLWYNYKVIPHNSGLIYVFVNCYQLKIPKNVFGCWFPTYRWQLTECLFKFQLQHPDKVEALVLVNAGASKGRMDWMGISKGTLYIPFRPTTNATKALNKGSGNIQSS